jgi:hypothetical protein
VVLGVSLEEDEIVWARKISRLNQEPEGVLGLYASLLSSTDYC